jgi:hypothetical protein
MQTRKSNEPAAATQAKAEHAAIKAEPPPPPVAAPAPAAVTAQEIAVDDPSADKGVAAGSAAAIAGTGVLAARDNYRRVPTRRA